MNYQVRKTMSALAFVVSAWPLAAQTQSPPAPAASAAEDETVILSPFEVTATKDSGYAATETLAGTRIRTDLRDVGSAITVITKELLNDLGATDNATLLQYTTNAEVGGTKGTFAGLGNGTGVDEGDSLKLSGGNQRVRGLAAADNTRDYFITDIPTDFYIVDRVDIQRGPNAILFGLGSPAGIVNTTLRNAEFRNKGEVAVRTGSYGSVRTSIDYNQEIIDNVLAIRVDGLWNNEKFKQNPAYQNDKRVYGTVRFDPQLFKDRSFRTSLKVKFENGSIDANRPRTVTPNDSITPWFKPMASSYTTWTQENGMGKTAVDNGYDANRSNIQEILDGNVLGLRKGMQTNNAANPNFQPWLGTSGINQQQPFWLQDGSTGETFSARAGYINPGARTSSGGLRTLTDGLAGKRYADQFFGLVGMNQYATTAKIPLAGSGQYRTSSLTDPTIFDFYNNLIDGPNKKEIEKWNSFNINLSQTAFNDRLGIDLSYDRQTYRRANENLLGGAPTITIDILKNHLDWWRNTTATAASGTGTSNTNFGRAYIATNSGGNGSSYESDRKYLRGSVFGELRARDFIKNDFLGKLIGKHRFNGVYSAEKFATETRGWNRIAQPLEWAAYWNGNQGTGPALFERPVTQVIYLGKSIAGQSSAAGANLPGVTANLMDLPNSSVSVFDSTWTGAFDTFGNSWTVPANLAIANVFDPATTHLQNENPANYKGWTSFSMNLLRYGNGEDLSLVTRANKALRETKSYAGSWQGFWWNEALVTTLGWRFDEVKNKDVSASNAGTPRQIYNMNPAVFKLSDTYAANQVFKDHSASGGAVLHLNRVFGDKDPLPINVSLSYNKSSNFQVTNTRRDVYGIVLGNPSGSTEDYGILLSTKDGKYSFRALKYKTEIKGASGQFDGSAIGGAIAAGITWRNVFLYKNSGYSWADREKPRSRNTWGGAANSLDLLPGGQGSPADTSLTAAEGRAREDAAIKGWNEIQAFVESKGFLNAWGIGKMVPQNVLTDRTTYENAKSSPTDVTPGAAFLPPDTTDATFRSYSSTAPSGLTVTADTVSKGYEFELTANPLPNWRLGFNASQTEAERNNVGGASFKELISFIDSKVLNTDGTPNYVGQLPQFGNLGLSWYLNRYAGFRGNYEQLKLQEGSAVPEIREWRWNVYSNYTFTTGKLKGFGVGASYRWEDEVIIGYPVTPKSTGGFTFDLNKPYYGPSEDHLDLWISYERKLTKRINWKIQLNVRDVGAGDQLIPISVQPDGKTWASVRIAPPQTWFVQNTLSF